MAFTFFFRDVHTLQHAVNFLLPDIQGLRQIRIWDAGCAMGQEPYTFAILLAEKMGFFAYKNVMIDATDIDESDTFGKIITNGKYPEGDLSRIPIEYFQKYFHKAEDEDGIMEIDSQIKNRVVFKKHDLLELQPFRDDYNLIICKNVLLHFQPEDRIKVINMYHSVLAKGGLFVTEQTQPMPDENKHQFEKIVSDANLYRKIS
ncbi:MAG: chemotaxis protein CheR [Candidatus Kapabacteria bacterium]|nr:chemotaxis protein CheR [Candidatus Kapabacteria bacterium]